MKHLRLESSTAVADPAGPDPAAHPCAALQEGVRTIAELVTVAALGRYRAAWADLARRTLDPNVFLDPAFALPLLQHVPEQRRLRILLVWADAGPAGFDRLLGLFPLELPRVRGSGAAARGFSHEQTSCGTPLVDRTHAAAVFAALTAWLAGAPGRPPALLLGTIERDGAFFAALRAFCAETKRPLTVLEEWQRAVLPRPKASDGRIAALTSAKRRKERARQSRRLSESGKRTYVGARTPEEVAAATERFLALEHRGWKGERGTSLLADPARATFVRTMTRLMAGDGRCRIDAIEIDGQPVAMGIILTDQIPTDQILTDQARAYFWKTTFDERFASLSPGVQFVLELTRAQQADPGVAVTDSCAIANHPMIDRLWAGRAAMVDVILAVRPDRRRAFDRSVRLQRWRRALRRRVKALWLSIGRNRGD